MLALSRMFSLACALIAVVPALATAQEASASEMAAARELFQEGVAAARQERWEEARTLFERSYRIVPRSSTLLNLASAQAETGQLVQAAESYRRFIADAGPRETRLRSSAEDALADIEGRLARVTISVEGLEGDDEIWLDEQIIGHGSLGIGLPVSPGDHVVTVARAGAAVAERRFSVGEGASGEVVLDASEQPQVEPAPVDPIAAPGPSVDEDDGGTIWSSPWLWVGIGAAVLAAVLIPIAITASSGASPHMGSLGTGSLSFQ